MTTLLNEGSIVDEHVQFPASDVGDFRGRSLNDGQSTLRFVSDGDADLESTGVCDICF